MDSFEYTKLAAAVLSALLVIVGTKTFIELNVGHAPAKPGYPLPVEAPDAETAKAEGDTKAEGEKADGEKPAAEGEAKDGEAKKAEGEKPAAEAAKAEGEKPAAKADAPAAETAKAEGEKPAAKADAKGGDIMALLAKATADNGKATFTKCKGCHVVEKGKPSTAGPNLWGVVNRPKASVEGFSYSQAMKGKGGDWTFEDLSQFLRSPKKFVPGTKMVFNGVPDPATEADLIAYLATLADSPVPLPK